MVKLYSGSTKDFVQDTILNEITDRLRESFEVYYGHKPNVSEQNAWSNSFQYLKNIIESSKLYDNMIVLEFELPYSNRRIDAMLFGKGENNSDNVVLIELKQWSKVEDTDIENMVYTYVGGANRLEPHPSIQVEGYHLNLQDFVSVFEEPNTDLYSCVYCHNYSKEREKVLFLDKFKEILKEHPLFAKEDVINFGKYLKDKIGSGQGLEIFNRFSNSAIRPSKKLIEHTKKMVNGQQVFNLIDEQLSANYAIIDRAKKASQLKRKCVIIVKGGPGTGKSVIALNALAELLSKGLTVYHATGSRAFTSTLKKVVGTRVGNFFKYFNSFTGAKENDIDVLICDEAHRIRNTSNSRYTRRENRTDTPQIEELIKISKVSIFFIDDYQVVRPTEIGSSDMIIETAKKYGAEIIDFELKTQFRCNGSDSYLNWIDNTLGINYGTKKLLDKDDKMEFKIFNNPQELYDEINKKNEEKPNSARMVAGYCWPWSNTNPDGTLNEDVVIGDFKMTWEAKDDSRVLAPGVVKASLWAYDPRAINQMGSIYTIQGFEFEYVGVIFAEDLIYNKAENKWIGDRTKTCDPALKGRSISEEQFTKYVKNIYRVLLSRGMKGCYIYFMNKDTEEYFRDRLNINLKYK